VGEEYLLPLVSRKKSQWGGIWKTIRQTLDRDSNGYILMHELEEVFKEYFPVELEGKSLRHWFSLFASI
jgi:hypothetical protein